MIKKINVENYKMLRKLELDFNDDLNIIVGDNETGKSTLLEAINLALTGQIKGRNIAYELSPYMFNKSAVDEYIEALRDGQNIAPPYILIELYLVESDKTARLKGRNNERREETSGVFLKIEFDNDYSDEYEKYISKPKEVTTVPTEYYCVKWLSFGDEYITKKRLPLNSTLIDTSTIRLQSGTDYYIQNIINDSLTPKEKVQLAIAYRKLKQSFEHEESLNRINTELKAEKGRITDKNLTVSIDMSQKTSWEATLTSYLDEIPFQYIGKGDQNILKTLFALERKSDDTDIILIEEPENHLSYSTMNKLIRMIEEKCTGKQLFMATHSTFVLNKLGLDKVILIGNELKTFRLNDLTADTKNYFKKLPGYDTLRLLIAKKAILVEGPSDELIVQKAYQQIHGVLPIKDGVDVISVRALSFKRFLEIAKLSGKNVVIVTDNDGDHEENIEKKYSEYFGIPNISFCYDKDDTNISLEDQIVRVNELNILNKILGCKKTTANELIDFMKNSKNKTECALKLFDCSHDLIIPQYIKDAIK